MQEFYSIMKGFSLLECIVALVFVAILSVIAMANNSLWQQKQLSNTFVDQLVHDLYFARQQAILRGTLVSICPTLDYKYCSDQSDWTQGYLIYTNEQILLSRKNTEGTLSNSRKAVEFAPNGFSHSTNSTFIYSLGEIERHVIINLQGRIRVE